jgi:hypothetical protein
MRCLSHCVLGCHFYFARWVTFLSCADTAARPPSGGDHGLNPAPAITAILSGAIIGLTHRLSQRLTASRNDVKPARRRRGSGIHHISRSSNELLDRAVARFDQAGGILGHLQNSLDGCSPAGNRAGRCYRVCFLNRFARGRDTITARRAAWSSLPPSRARPRSSFKQRFAELEGLPDWQLHASFIEAGLLDDNATATREAD